MLKEYVIFVNGVRYKGRYGILGRSAAQAKRTFLSYVYKRKVDVVVVPLDEYEAMWAAPATSTLRLAA